jgi:type VI secretion system secreted protein VgrG
LPTSSYCTTVGRSLNDYDYVKPSKKLFSSRTAASKYAKGDYAVYDYPGRYDGEERGEQLAKFRLQAEQSFDWRRHCDGNAPALFPGTLLTITEHPTGSENGPYLLTHCNHRFSGNEYYSAGGQYETASVYRGSYELLPQDRPFRTFPSTPRPKIYGIQTAKVVGKEGEESEEISTDEHGRIWVQFPWDRDKQNSCPVRVAQAWAGPRWGEIFLPRVGMEVVVEYLEGDPDYPLVVGCVYNGDNKVPYDLPKNKTIAGWKSRSTKASNGYNELILEDKKGQEQIRMHAQNALNVTVLGSETREIGADLKTTIKHAEKRTIGEKFEIPMGSPARDTQIKSGDDKLKVDTGNITYEAAMKIELKVGPSVITIEPWGITLDAPMITINGTGPVMINGLPVKIN